MLSRLRYTGFCRAEKVDWGSRWESTDFGGIAIEKLQAFQAGRVELVINVVGEVRAHIGFTECLVWEPIRG